MTKKLLATILIIFSLVFSSALAAAEPAEPKIAVIVKSSESEYWQIIMDGAKVAGLELGANIDGLKKGTMVTTQGPVAESDIDKQIAMLENAISTQPNAIVLAPSASAPLVPAIEKAAQAGIPVIIIDSAANTLAYTSFISSDNEKIGRMAADAMARALKKKYGKVAGKVAGISFLNGAGSLEKRRRGFEETIKAKYPEIEIVDYRDAQGKIGIAINIAQDYLTRYKDLRGIFASNQPTGDETVRALDMAGRKDLAVVVVDAGPMEVWGVENNIVDSMIVQKPWVMGYMGVEYALKAIKGEKLPKFIETDIVTINKKMIEDGSADEFLDPVSFHNKEIKKNTP